MKIIAFIFTIFIAQFTNSNARAQTPVVHDAKQEQADHQMWTAEHIAWSQEHAQWEKDHQAAQAAAKDFSKIVAMHGIGLKKHKKELDQHAQTIQAHDQNLQSSSPSSEKEANLDQIHAQDKKEHEQLKANHLASAKFHQHLMEIVEKIAALKKEQADQAEAE
jgi:hypothetical protein